MRGVSDLCRECHRSTCYVERTVAGEVVPMRTCRLGARYDRHVLGVDYQGNRRDPDEPSRARAVAKTEGMGRMVAVVAVTVALLGGDVFPWPFHRH